MSIIMKPVVSTKNFVKKHRVAIAIIATTVLAVKVNHMALSDHNEFLKEKGLYEEFYTPEPI